MKRKFKKQIIKAHMWLNIYMETNEKKIKHGGEEAIGTRKKKLSIQYTW